jgi:hypothetical protein
MDNRRYQELISEGRAQIINGIFAYGLAFEVLSEDEIDEELAENLDYSLQAMEAMVPSMKALYALDQRRSGTDESFIEWLSRYLGKMK